MTDLIIHDESVAAKLLEIAQRENRSVDEVLADLLRGREPELKRETAPDEAVRAVRLRTYERARRYWREHNDPVRAAMTDEVLDEQFWLFDEDGIPRLKSEQAQIELAPDPLAEMARAALEANLIFVDNNVSERADEILRAEYADYMIRRMNRHNVDE